jgi:predicted small secreted protein
MRKWNVLTALLALAFIVTPAMGQDIESLAKAIKGSFESTEMEKVS